MSQRKLPRSLVRFSALVAAIAVVFTLDARANLIGDGSFEGNGVATPNNASYGYGSAGIPGWTVIARGASYNVQWLSNGSYPYLQSFDGLGFLDMTGNPDNGPAAVQQSFASTVGTAYRATFELGYSNSAYGGSNGPVGMIVSMGGDFPGTNGQTFTAGPGGSVADQPNVVWTQFAYDFTATSESTTLRFEGTFIGGNYTENFIGLDAINVDLGPVAPPDGPPVIVLPPVNGAVPEPASLALLGLGIVGGLFVRRRALAVTPRYPQAGISTAGRFAANREASGATAGAFTCSTMASITIPDNAAGIV